MCSRHPSVCLQYLSYCLAGLKAWPSKSRSGKFRAQQLAWPQRLVHLQRQHELQDHCLDMLHTAVTPNPIQSVYREREGGGSSLNTAEIMLPSKALGQ